MATSAGFRMFPIAIDLWRFSGAQQEAGDSRRRQKSLADAWSERTSIPIDLHMGEEGVSGYSDQARRLTDETYDLARLLKYIEAGRVQRGDYLLVENFDRLSRDKEVAATNLLTSILVAGVKVVQLAPYELELTENSDIFSIFRAVMELARGHGESERKHQVVSDSYANNRVAAAGGEETYQGRLPEWLQREGEGKGARRRAVALDVERAAVVRDIFRLAAEGWGYGRIAQRLNAAGVPAFGAREARIDPETGQQARGRAGRPRWRRGAGGGLGSGRWTRAYVQKILCCRAAMGELETRTGEVVPVPAAVSEEEWLAAQAGRAERAERRGAAFGRGGRPRGGAPENVFAGLLSDARSGQPLHSVGRMGKGRKWRVLVNAGGAEGETVGTSFPEPIFEAAVLLCLAEIVPGEVLPARGPDRVSVISGRQEMVRGQLAGMQAELAACTKAPKGMAAAMAQLEAEEERLEQERRQASLEAAHPLSEAWGQAQTLLDVAVTAEERLRLRSLLRRLVEGVLVLIVPRGWDRVAAVQMRFKGSEAARSYLVVYRKGVRPDGRKAARCRGEKGEDLWAVRSLREAQALDLRQPAHVAALGAQLESLDLAAVFEPAAAAPAP